MIPRRLPFPQPTSPRLSAPRSIHCSSDLLTKWTHLSMRVERLILLQPTTAGRDLVETFANMLEQLDAVTHGSSDE
jgi:hypothetical protein